MASYYVNRIQQANADHEVHTTGCQYMPSEANRIYLGDFTNCAPAVVAARQYYLQSNGCYTCCRACHTS